MDIEINLDIIDQLEMSRLLDGKFIDYAVVEKAKRVYALAQAIMKET